MKYGFRVNAKIGAGILVGVLAISGGAFFAWKTQQGSSDHGPQQVTSLDGAPATASPARQLPEEEDEVGGERTPATAPAPVPSGNIELRAPQAPERWSETSPYANPESGLRAMAFHFNASVYDRPQRRPTIKGTVRRGTMLNVRRQVFGPGCRDGRWYEVEGGGFVCTGDGFVVSENPNLPWVRYGDLTRALPFEYALVTRGAPRFRSLPESGDEGSELNGDYFVTIVDRVEHNGETFVKTAIGQYLRASDVTPAEAPNMHGVLLEETGLSLPLAFVRPLEEAVPLFRIDDGSLEQAGSAHRHARFSVERQEEVEGHQLVISRAGIAAERDSVRLVEAIERPERVPPSTRWIHVNLSRQTLVAYSAEDTPVFATLIASGKEGYDTPAGTFRIREKHRSITMSGADPHDGPYEVEEVPWTMYYFEGFALHGAYWHDDFGQVRSHGCTNLAPHDARWLFEWTTPEVPDGWQGRRLRAGTYVHLTRDPAPGEEEATEGE